MPCVRRFGKTPRPGPRLFLAPELRVKAKSRIKDKLQRHRNVNHLERLATAAWIRKREGVSDADLVDRRLHELKPHISLADARQADAEVQNFFSGN